MSITIISSIVRGLNKAVSASERIAQGDLTQDLQAHSSDEIGKLISSMQHMQENLKNMLTEMNQSSTELAAASEELASVSEETNANTHNQQGEIDQMAAAMEQMSATVQEVAQNAASTSEFTKHANSEAETGARTVQNAAAAIEKLATSVASAAELLDALEKKSESISSVLDVIKSVAEQTNLLALNAAIEAARAGEQGRGFAVVADEVRILAQRTQQSTEEIEAMISSVQSGTADAVSAMSLSRDLASTSVEHARNCGLALDNITQVVAQINNMNLQIATAAEEQARVAEEVSANVCTISGIGQQNSAAANQTSSSSQELSQMAINLQELICKFKV
ncbi:MAG: HAMP domain-containing methyl-accepting chemotaxis protein, partial [Gammaproteobacteria bacterium]|nr:HAMP domain-containing methyl-accepting chemotaxis protein [Gammaproteobacteria bacterium]